MQTSPATTVSATTAIPPVVTATGDASVNEPTTASPQTYTLTLSADSSAAGASTVAGWNIDWGDGNQVYYPGGSQTVNYDVPIYWTGLAIIATAQTAATAPSPLGAIPACDENLVIQPRRLLGSIPRLLAASGIVYPWALTRLTA